jgi:hypothetical protein
MIWADKLFLVLAFLIVGFILVIGGHFETMTVGGWGNFALKILLPIWVVLRGLDWIAGGPARRRAERRHKVDAYLE